MINIGEYNTLTVAKFTDFGLYLTDGSEEILLPKKYIPEYTELEQKLEVFVYNDSKGRPIATTLKPYAIAGDFAFLKVKDTNNIGAFLDIGIEKDILVPKNQQQTPMETGKSYVVKLLVDFATDRLYATSKLSNLFETDTSIFQMGQAVNILVFAITDIGFKVVVDNRFEGLIYKSEVFEPLNIGDEKIAYIKNIREDKKLDISLQKQKFIDAVTDIKNQILHALSNNDNFLPLHDKSSPEEIKNKLKMSKKSFKKGIGMLNKEGKVKIEKDGVRLLNK